MPQLAVVLPARTLVPGWVVDWTLRVDDRAIGSGSAVAVAPGRVGVEVGIEARSLTGRITGSLRFTVEVPHSATLVIRPPQWLLGLRAGSAPAGSLSG